LDIVIRGGTVLDGTERPKFLADIGIENGKVVMITSPETLQAQLIIDAQGLIVSPGFIDIHTHSDFALLVNNKAESSIRQGVTTSIIGACGRSCAPVNDDTKDLLLKDIIGYNQCLPVTWHTFEEYLSELEKRGVAQNVAALVAHNAVRIAVMGYEDRAPTTSELEEMKALVQESMKAGAIGFSTGLAYPPGGNAETNEIIELAKVAARYDGIYTSHLRGTDGDVIAGAQEALQVGEEAKIPVHIGHFCGFFGNIDETMRGLRMIEDARSRGMDVTVDLYPYFAGANPLMAFFPQSIFSRDWKDLGRAFRDTTQRRALAEEIRRSQVGAFWFTRDDTMKRIKLFDVQSVKNQSFKNKSVYEIGQLKQMEPLEATLDVLADEENEMYSTGAICEWMGELDNYTVYKKPYHMVGSDGIALAPYGDLAGFKFHPRAYGAFPRIIARYVREKRILTLNEAIRKMTSLPAQRVGILDRGVIKKGNWADIVIFEYEKIVDTSTYEQPSLYPDGIKYVLVNGQVVVDGTQHTGRLVGRVLRHPVKDS